MIAPENNLMRGEKNMSNSIALENNINLETLISIINNDINKKIDEKNIHTK